MALWMTEKTGVAGVQSASFLHRTSVPGHPELNQMNSSIDMNANDIVNVNVLNTNTAETSGRVISGSAIRIGGLAKPGSFCEKDHQLGRAEDGRLYVCRNNLWSSVFESHPSGAVAYFNLASCPQGWYRADGQAGRINLQGVFIRGFGSRELEGEIYSSGPLGQVQGDAVRHYPGRIRFGDLLSGRGTPADVSCTGAFQCTAVAAAQGARMALTAGAGTFIREINMQIFQQASSGDFSPRNVAQLVCIRE
jgi:hypothetical protein